MLNNFFKYFFVTIFVLLVFSCDSGIKRIGQGNIDDSDDVDISETDQPWQDGDDTSVDTDNNTDFDSPAPDKDKEIPDGEFPDDTDPCEGEDCNGKGTCQIANGKPYCECDENFFPVVGELLCVNDCVNESGDILSGSPCTHPANQDLSWSKDCYTASCNPEGLCVGASAYGGHTCSDNLDPAGWDDGCYEGVCNGTSCQGVKLPVGTNCDDSVFCNGAEQCNSSGKCISSGNPCLDGDICNNSCNEEEENCFSSKSTSCDDGNPCTGDNFCSGDGDCIYKENPCNFGQTCTPDSSAPEGYTCCEEGTFGENCGICVRMVIPTSMLPVLPDGKTWGKAYTDIQEALNDLNGLSAAQCPDGKEVWISEGKYTPGSMVNVFAGISIYGGFDGTESSRDIRNWKNNETIISGESLSGARLFTLNANTVIDGLTISASNYIRVGADAFGGAVLINGSSNIRISNCIFTNNRAEGQRSGATNRHGFGGAIAILNTSTNILIEDSVFQSNQSTGSAAGNSFGGAIFIRQKSNASIKRVTFIENQTREGGGAIYSNDSTVTIERVLFHKNNSGARGGGVHTDNVGKTIITNSIFTENNAVDFGGAVYTRDNGSVSTVTNCSFWGNSVTNQSATAGATFHNFDRGSSVIKNSIIWNNIRGNSVQNNQNGSSTATYSNIAGSHTGDGNINSDPLFIDPANGNLKLGTGSPSINTGTPDGAPLEDYDGNSRPKGAGYDMGAYEQ